MYIILRAEQENKETSHGIRGESETSLSPLFSLLCPRSTSTITGSEVKARPHSRPLAFTPDPVTVCRSERGVWSVGSSLSSSLNRSHATVNERAYIPFEERKSCSKDNLKESMSRSRAQKDSSTLRRVRPSRASRRRAVVTMVGTFAGGQTRGGGLRWVELGLVWFGLARRGVVLCCVVLCCVVW